MFGGPRRGGLVRGVARTAVVAGTATAVVGGVHRRQSRRWAEQEQQDVAEQQAAYDQGQLDAQSQQPAPAPAPAPAPSATEDVVVEADSS